MSTFDGFVEEFPLIRIDCFRPLPGKAPPFACFLSHVHSDHLTGLESLRSPFVYCSSATRELLLRLEKYPHRVNLSRGILERRIQTYRHLYKILKPLPLDTPTKLELCPGNNIQVTLLDANHCLGAVMFLIEGQGNAILYTGDIRSEPWWINALTQHPIVLPYAAGIRRLKRIYLDTTFAAKIDPYMEFQSKAEGIKELLHNISTYSQDTLFYFRAWTFGYEDVWIALSTFLQSRIHLDEYRYRLYTSIGACGDSSFAAREAACLAGFICGNSRHTSILTRDPTARIHSCERGSGCSIWNSNKKVVEIIPIVSRRDGLELRELGAGGGKGDLDQTPELDLRDQATVKHLLDLCQVEQKNKKISNIAVEDIRTTVSSTNARLELPNAVMSTDALKLSDLPAAMGYRSSNQEVSSESTETIKLLKPDQANQAIRPSTNSITFPYARHSSYAELRALVSTFQPEDVFPCTVSPPEEWEEELSMEMLFGDLCHRQGEAFASDDLMRAKKNRTLAAANLKRKRPSEQETQSDNEEEWADAASNLVEVRAEDEQAGDEVETASNDDSDLDETENDSRAEYNTGTDVPILSSSQRERLWARRDAFRAASRGTWHEIKLASVNNEDTDEEL